MKMRPVDVLNNLKGHVLWPQSYHLSEDEAKTCIKALEQQEPCEDCISRENTLKAIIEQLGIRNEDYLIPAEATLYKVIKRMPPVTPQQKMGHWTEDQDDSRRWDRIRYYCSECGRWQSYGMTKYCPHCGARMENEG